MIGHFTFAKGLPASSLAALSLADSLSHGPRQPAQQKATFSPLNSRTSSGLTFSGFIAPPIIGHFTFTKAGIVVACTPFGPRTAAKQPGPPQGPAPQPCSATWQPPPAHWPRATASPPSPAATIATAANPPAHLSNCLLIACSSSFRFLAFASWGPSKQHPFGAL